MIILPLIDPLALRIDGTNSPTAEIDWGGQNLTNVLALDVGTDVLVANISGYTGKVGINTATPAYALDVVGSIKGNGSGLLGVWGKSIDSFGVFGESEDYYGVYGSSATSYGVYGYSGTSYGVYGESLGSYAGYFNGSLFVNSTATIDTLQLSSGLITDSGPGISFANKNLSTSGMGTFGQIGVGTSPGSQQGILNTFTSSLASIVGIRNSTICTCTSNPGTLIGLGFSHNWEPSNLTGFGTISANFFAGSYGGPKVDTSNVSGSGEAKNVSVANMPAYYADITAIKGGLHTGTLTVVNAYGLWAREPALTNAVVTNMYGIYFDDFANASNNWGIYNSGTANNYMGADGSVSMWGTTNTDLQIYSDGTNGIIDVATALRLGNFETDYTQISATGNVLLPAGAIGVGRAPILFQDGNALTTPESGAIEFNDGRFYITNVAHQRAIDRTSDVAVESVTCDGDAVVNGGDSTNEIILWTGVMDANSLVIGNVFKFHADGVVDSASNGDLVTLRVKVNNVTKATLQQDTKKMVADHWHINANATQRTIGSNGSRAIHLHLEIDEIDSYVISVADINTTESMDVTLTAQWNNEDAGNVISLHQAFMEYKN